MAMCKGCGKQIQWILMANGAKMPTETERVVITPNKHGNVVVVTAEGKTERGFKAEPYTKAPTVVGYISHFAACSAGEKFRKAK